MPNGIDLILADHRMVDELFAAFAETADGTIVGKVIDALAAHDDAEHGALYPTAEALLGADAIGDVLERSALAHSAVKKQIDECKFLEGAPLADAFGVLQALVQDHVQDEEKNLLPALEKAATPAQLDVLGSRILQAKQRVG
jgi:hemerythrin superfamily protein